LAKLLGLSKLLWMAKLKVVIVGCGIGGATTAIALTASGMDVELYEQASELREVGAGVGLWANALRALEPFGMSEKVLSLSRGPVGTGVRRPDGQWLMRLPRDVMESRWGGAFVSVHRAELHALLVAGLNPATVHLGARCAGFEQENGRVLVRFDNGDEIETDVLVGADGVHSVVRAGLSGPARLRYRGYTNWRGVTPPGSVPPISEGMDTWGRGGHFGLQPTSDDRILWYAGRNAEEGMQDDDHIRQQLFEMFGGWHDPIPAVIEATPTESLVRNDIYDCWPCREWSRGSIVLVGDAIHPMTPDLGQGACQAIVDGTTLAACLSADDDVLRALNAYRRARYRKAAIAMIFSRIWGGAGQLEGRVTCAIRDAFLKAMPLSLQLRQLDLVIHEQSHS
jgi:2-polyprenyl-6-methoxyphenol hydroxylase-like FAD-dependent oxidoreductase